MWIKTWKGSCPCSRQKGPDSLSPCVPWHPPSLNDTCTGCLCTTPTEAPSTAGILWRARSMQKCDWSSPGLWQFPTTTKAHGGYSSGGWGTASLQRRLNWSTPVLEVRGTGHPPTVPAPTLALVQGRIPKRDSAFNGAAHAKQNGISFSYITAYTTNIGNKPSVVPLW